MPSNSHIQRALIAKLKNADSLRYSDLRDPSIDRDLFNYHLRQVVANGLVTKLPNQAGYCLSDKGQQRVADSLHTSDQADRLFKINPVLIVPRIINGELHILNQTRTSQPNFGIVGIPGGTIIKAEPLLEGAARKLLEETGLRAMFEYIAMTRRIQSKQGLLFSDVLFPICLATQVDGEPKTTLFGSNAWVPIDTAIANEGTRIEYIPRVLQALRDNAVDTLRGTYHEQIVDSD